MESYLIADSVVGVIAQRLVRVLCPHCKQQVQATEEELELLGEKPGTRKMIYKAVGCPKCDNMGYLGRTGVYEIMEMTPELKRIISRHATADEIKEQALKDGMHTLRMSAISYVEEGVTTVGEMMRVSFDT